MAEATRDALAIAVGASVTRLETRRDELAAVAARTDPATLIAALEAIELRRGELTLNPTAGLAIEGLLATIAAGLRGEHHRWWRTDASRLWSVSTAPRADATSSPGG